MPFEKWLYTIPLRIRSIFGKRRLDRDLDDELRYHVEQQTAQNIAKGMAPHDARTTALRSLGGLAQHKEAARDARGLNLIEDLRRDSRYAWRALWRYPGLSVVVIVMLALGIGATTALFSMFHQLLVEPLDVPAPGRLVNLSADGPKWGSTSCGPAGGCDAVFSYPMFRDLEEGTDGLTGIAAHNMFTVNLSFGDQTRDGRGMAVSGAYFAVLGLEPAIGRLIAPSDEPRLGESSLVVLSYDYWQNQFGGDPGIVNQTLRVNGVPLTVIGVAPAGFSGTTLGVQAQVFVPLTLYWRLRQTPPRTATDRRAYWLYVFARLDPGATVEQASAAINARFRGILSEVDAPLNSSMPDDVMEAFLGQQIALDPGHRGQSRVPETNARPLTILFGLTILVLLIVCVNIANLLLARGAARSGEMAIRASLGGSRRQLVSQLLTESTWLALIGGILSLPVAVVILDVITAIVPPFSGSKMTIALSPEATAFAAGASLLTVLLFGMFPAIQTARPGPTLPVQGAPLRTTGGRGMARFRSSLATAQIAFSMVLLVLAGLFSLSLVNVARVDLGMDLDGLVSFSIAPRRNGYGPEQTRAVFDRIEEELATTPGVTGVTAARIPLITNSGSDHSVTIEGFADDPSVDSNTRRNEVSPSFFRTLSIPLLAGRTFTDADTLAAPNVAVVNESFVRKFNLGAGAVGTRFSGYPYDNVQEVEFEVIGVVADAAYHAVKDDIPPQYYHPWRQNADPTALTFYVRSDAGTDSLMRAIPDVVARVDSQLPVTAMITLRRQVQDNVFLDRLLAILSSGFAGLATLLASVGLYGLLAFSVAQRTPEFGLRLALGAEPARLRAMVLGQVGRMGLIGGIIGLGAAIALGRTAEALLFGLSGYDPWVLAGAATVLSGVVLVAGYLPARRASRVTPMEALRYE